MYIFIYKKCKYLKAVYLKLQDKHLLFIPWIVTHILVCTLTTVGYLAVAILYFMLPNGIGVGMGIGSIVGMVIGLGESHHHKNNYNLWNVVLESTEIREDAIKFYFSPFTWSNLWNW